MNYDTKAQDTIIINKDNGSVKSNLREGVIEYKLTPTDGLVEYSFDDGRVYRLSKRKAFVPPPGDTPIP